MKSILFVAEYGSINGGENSLSAILPLLHQAGFQASALVPEPSRFADRLKSTGVGVQPFSFTEDGVRKPLDSLRAELAQRFHTLRPDLVHCNSLSASRICGPAIQHAGIPGVGYIRDIMKLSKQATRDLNGLDKLVAVSQAVKQWHVEHGIDAHRVAVIYNGVDSDLFTPRTAAGPVNHSIDIREELQLGPDAKLVLYVGQVGLRKGLETWLEAADRVARARPDTHFLMVGARHSTKAESIEYEQMLRNRSQSGPLENRVHWLGLRDDVPQLMQQSTVLLHCARQEPLGRVLLEACASGLPVVATDVGGTREILFEPAQSRFLIPRDDQAAAANAVMDLLNDSQLRKQTSAQVRRMAIERFPVDRCADALIRLYQEVLSQPKRDL